MKKFIVRIELRKSEDADYDELHKKMSENGFYRHAGFSGSDQAFHLPNAEYMYLDVKGLRSISYICQLAKVAAEAVRPYPKVLVVEVKDSFQFGLDVCHFEQQ